MIIFTIENLPYSEISITQEDEIIFDFKGKHYAYKVDDRYLRNVRGCNREILDALGCGYNTEKFLRPVYRMRPLGGDWPEWPHGLRIEEKKAIAIRTIWKVYSYIRKGEGSVIIPEEKLIDPEGVRREFLKKVCKEIWEPIDEEERIKIFSPLAGIQFSSFRL